MTVVSRSKLIVLAAVAALLAALVVAPRALAPASGGASPAAAARWLRQMISHGMLQPDKHIGHATRLGKVVQEVSGNWSGYGDDNTSGTTYTKVSGTWTEPTLTCPADENRVAVFWVGVDGFSDSTVEQDGTLAECFEGSQFDYTWWEMYPTNNIQIAGSSVLPGDHVVSSVSFARSKYTLKVTDSTHSANSFSTAQSCGSGLTCENSSAEWIGEAPGFSRGEAPLPDFGGWKVTAAKVTGSGTAGVISSFPDDAITMQGSFGENLAKPGNLNSAGNSFTDNWNFAW